MFKFVLICTLVAVAVARSPPSKFASTDDAHAEVIYFTSDVNENGFQYAYDTTNNIHAIASGNENGDHQGGFSWISPEGKDIAIQYVADENGYQPRGDVLPTPPPIPAAILRALEYIRTHPPKEESQTKPVIYYGTKNSGRRF
ncbi:larval cuticle protein 2-like [Musca autumnalis]|uniref:larval cuticle protein 2-like n=1 Tax=Musca autumnalis TaxID=221902 RepID=UPI003CEEE3F7